MKVFFNLVAGLVFGLVPILTHGQGNAFTYQGRLSSQGVPVNGLYDFQFTLHDAASNGAQVGGPLATNALPVTNGLFNAILDFGPGVFGGAERWLQVSVRTNNAPSFNLLGGRQIVTSVPYAITAGTITGPLPAAQITGVLDPARIPTLDASKVGAGTLAPERLPVAVLLNNQTGATLTGTFNGTFSGDGGGLTNLGTVTTQNYLQAKAEDVLGPSSSKLPVSVALADGWAVPPGTQDIVCNQTGLYLFQGVANIFNAGPNGGIIFSINLDDVAKFNWGGVVVRSGSAIVPTGFLFNCSAGSKLSILGSAPSPAQYQSSLSLSFSIIRVK